MSDPKASQPIVLHMYNTPTVEKGKRGGAERSGWLHVRVRQPVRSGRRPVPGPGVTGVCLRS